MQVFHGSYTEIEDVDLKKCQSNKDFGRGFYVTKIQNQAQQWANIIGKIYQTDGVVTEFIFYDKIAFSTENLKTLRFVNYDAQWFDFIILNRNLETTEQQHDYDIVEGPIADDKVQRRINRYLEGKISREDFFEQLSKYPEPSHQICFCTVNSLRMLKKINNETIIEIEDLSEMIVEKLVSDLGFDEKSASEKFFSSNTFSKLSDTRTNGCNNNWLEVYKLVIKELDVNGLKENP